MADINVERKRPSLWPWLIGLLLLIAGVYLAALVLDARDAAHEKRFGMTQASWLVREQLTVMEQLTA